MLDYYWSWSNPLMIAESEARRLCLMIPSFSFSDSKSSLLDSFPLAMIEDSSLDSSSDCRFWMWMDPRIIADSSSEWRWSDPLMMERLWRIIEDLSAPSICLALRIIDESALIAWRFFRIISSLLLPLSSLKISSLLLLRIIDESESSDSSSSVWRFSLGSIPRIIEDCSFPRMIDDCSSPLMM